MVKPRRVVDVREKAWQHLLDTHTPFEVNAIRIIESDIFAPQTIELKRVIALIGLHGTGKTVFLRMLEAAFGYTTPTTVPPFVGGGDNRDEPSEIQGIIEIELNTPNGRVSRQINLQQPASDRRQIWTEATNATLEASYISPLYLFAELMILYQDFRSYRPRELGKGKNVKDGKLKAVNQILGREYRRISIYSEYMNEEDSGLYIPYISADTDRGTIDASMMSQGELWVNYVLNWFLDDDIEEGSLALLDEPEAFLAVRAQRPFIDQVAIQALAKNLQIVIATHSPEVLVRLPLANLFMCVTSNDGMRLISPSSLSKIREGVGIQTSIRKLILVEDRLAKRILSILFARYDGALSRETELVVADGAEQAVNGLKALQNAEKIASLGVLDADKRTKYTGSTRILFLPGTSSPEEEMLSKASYNSVQTAARLKISIEDLTIALSLCLGLDHHYWIKTVAASLGFPEEMMEYELIQIWLEDVDVMREFEKLVKDIRSFPENS